MLFTVEIDEEWFKVLDSLIAATLRGPKATPEEALAIIIFFQFKLQRLKMIPKGGSMFPHDPQPQELADYWDGYKDVSHPPYPDSEIDGGLIPRCIACGIEAEEWDTACFECGGQVG